MANLFYDQAGFCLLGDIHEHCSYGPWKRGLNKVMAEENFHLRNGRTWSKRMAAAGGATRDELQRAVDWMFPLTVEWFGLPDAMKRHSTQLDYRLKGKTNDQLRQWWLSLVVPYCEEIGGRVPAHRESQEEDGAQWVLDYPFPSSSTPRRGGGTPEPDHVGRGPEPLARPRAPQRRDGRRVPGGVPPLPPATRSPTRRGRMTGSSA